MEHRNTRNRALHIVLALLLLLPWMSAWPALADEPPALCPAGTTQYSGTQSSGAPYMICVPEPWNGDVLVYAHGYVSPYEPLGIPEDQLQIPDGPSLPEMVTGLGYAFAASGFSTNGLAAQEGLADSVDLVDILKKTVGTPRYVYLGGPSQGGLITALGIERESAVFDGGLSACGPIGDFGRQINYWGDVRVLFDYFFPGVLPAWTPKNPMIDEAEVVENWETYQGAIRVGLQNNPGRTLQLLRTANVPMSIHDTLQTGIEDLIHLLWYHVHATNDGMAKLGGQPFDNQDRWYSGSLNDLRLNRSVARFTADQVAVDTIGAYYQTSGQLSVPLVTLHTLSDPIVPYWHDSLYGIKTLESGSTDLHTNLPAVRHGHCAFSASEALLSFAWLTYQVSGEVPTNSEQVLTSEATRVRFRELARQRGLPLR